MTPEQCRAARGWLDWSQPDLSKRANVGLSTIRQFENGLRTPIANNLLAMKRAFEEAGLTLLESPAGIAVRGDAVPSDQKGNGEAP
ncbi:helix-turn-helix domain-containing protein [Methylobacterium nonmethylotrophicum]|uniref:XRE family transcriptional regulator n=1 Tax=Methylobacterium nonmethylotrophicum TaxID=1141884 RepID=A0A4Z0NSU6_9HYPH|nr:helix-turn-helix transcriptional regulator [Methylobacterium nonmethylotrophicum]TGD99107.1 XRE family transcriptional regulator [Methylobacterium nonmethylotrophicum]